MKYRVRIDLLFDNQDDPKVLMDTAKKLARNAVSINLGQPNEEIGYCELELCGHDEGKPCERLDRVEVR